MRVAAVVLGVLGSAMAAGAQPYLECHMIPGWEQSGTARNYTADNLYEYKDGGAEGYFVFGFTRMQGIDCKAGAATLAIDVSEMAGPDDAWGMFAANRDSRQPNAPIGMGGQLLAQSAMFAKGRYFVEIVETDGNASADVTAALKGFAAKMAPMLEGRETPPNAVKWFPAERLVEVKLVPESVLGIGALKRGFVAQYDSGQAFVVQENSAEAAAATMKKMRDRFAAVADVKVADEAFQGKVPYLDGICVFRKGKFVAGYANLPDAGKAAALAAALVGRLPAE